MEFNEKLQNLRKQKNMTQEELAQVLFVSRTAVSKWESGRGYPNIDSLKAIAEFFNVTVDELLSGEEILNIAKEDNAEKEGRFRDLIFGLLDAGFALFLFLPFFGENANGVISTATLLQLTKASAYLKICYLVLVAVTVIFGILTLALQNIRCSFWLKNKNRISLILNVGCVFVFIISQQPYAAAYTFMLLIIKAFAYFKKQ